MINAKDEFIAHIAGIKNSPVKCAKMSYRRTYKENKIFILKIGYTKEDFDEFCNGIDFTYNNEYGRQYVFGTIWYMDGTWSERFEYDGAEKWDYKQCPLISKDCEQFIKGEKQ